MDASIQVLNNTIYDYFARNYGHIETIPGKNLENKYKDYTVKDLKKALKCLKLSTNSDITEIKYVLRVLRDKLRNSNNTQTFIHSFIHLNLFSHGGLSIYILHCFP